MTAVELNNLISMAGTVAFAITAVLAVAPKGVDIFGVTVLGVITAIGGGTIRDLILDVPVFWSTDLSYIWVAVGASIAAFAANSIFTRKRMYGLMLYLDGLGVALFSIYAVDKVWDMSFGLPLVPIILGVTTAIGGGLIRDVLADVPTLLMKKEIYAIPVLLGCTVYVLILSYIPEYKALGSVFCMILIFAWRAAAIHWDLSVPNWLSTQTKTKK